MCLHMLLSRGIAARARPPPGGPYTARPRERLIVFTPQIVGADILSGCKEPERHFALVRDHIARLRQKDALRYSHVTVVVERNLAFEADHLARALITEENVTFYKDERAGRFGVMTTENVKLGAMTLTNIMLREKRIHMLPEDELASQDARGARLKVREQLGIYSLQFKQPENVFQKSRYALSGKVGGMKDDLVICLQLGIYWTEAYRLVGEGQ